MIEKIAAKKKKLRENLSKGEKVFVLDKKIKKKFAPRKFYKQTVQNMPYFNKKTVLDKNSYYWLKMKKKTNIYEKDFKEVNYLQLLTIL